VSLKPKHPAYQPEQRHQRPHEANQQIARSVRPQLPRDGSANGQNNVRDRMPAGFVAVWDFGNGDQTKYSPTWGGGKKVY
jgi:hypothetical protein